MLPFAAAREIVRNLKLKGVKEWKEWSKSGKRPSNIPGCPHQTYRDDGWISMPDWLGYEGGQGAFLPFAVARAIVRKLELKSVKEWKEWSKSGQRPSNIPSAPDETYRDDGWISMPDWLGYAGGYGAMLPFLDSRAIVRRLKLKGQREWEAWCKAGERPSNIPSTPSKVYRDDGWISWPDWLGSKGRILASDMLPFAAARMIVRKLKLKSQKEWEVWRKAGKRPSNIPAGPANVYRDDGWISTADWLGYGLPRGARTASRSSSSSSASTAPKKKKKRKRRPAAPHPDSPPPPPPPPTSHPKRRIKTEEPRPSDASDDPTTTTDDPPLRKIKKEEEA
jgi:hypothetical protein